MNRLARAYLWASLALLIPSFLPALDPDRALTQYVHDFWNMEKGLPNPQIYSMTQTRDGYLWLATLGGLIRFDGVRFITFDSSVAKEMQATQCYWVSETPDGTLWIGTYGGGLYAYKNGKFRKYGKKDGMSDERILTIYPDKAGNVWLGDPNGVIRMRDGQFTTFGKKEGLPGSGVWAIYEDHAGTLWAGTAGGGAYQFRGGSFTKYSGIKDTVINSFLEDKQGNFWIGTSSGLCRLRNDRVQKYNAPVLAGDSIPALLEDRKGNVWIGTDHGITRFHNEQFESLTPQNGLTQIPGDSVGSEIISLYEDREGNLWAGGSDGGLNRFHDARFVAYSRDEGLADNLVASIHESKNGDIWIGHQAGISRLRHGKIDNYPLDQSIARGIMTVFEDSGGTVWVGTIAAGLYIFNDGKFSPFSTTDKLLGKKIWSIYEDVPGSLWVASLGYGISHLENGKLKQTFTVKDGLSSVVLRAFHKDQDGSLLITTDEGVNKYKDGRFSVYIPQSLLGDIVWTIHRDRAGVLWMGSNGGGLKRFQNGKVVAIRKIHGLFEDVVADILEDDTENLWMSSPKGIFKVNKKELNDFANGKVSEVHSIVFGKSDGMKEVQCVFGAEPSAWKSSDGKLWFPTFKGIVMIDPEKDQRNLLPPPVSIEQLVAGDKAFEPQTPGLELDPGRRNLEFHYTALSLRVPERVRFKYMLEGYDKGWQEAGARRVAYYTNLPPRPYRFRVIASNDDGVWNQTGASFPFRIKPYFYETVWFYGSWLLGGIVIAFTAYRVRVASLKKRELVLINTVAEKTSELRDANSKLLEAQDRITKLLETQSQTVENIPAWSESAARDIAKVVGASTISVWIRQNENFQPWGHDGDEPPLLEDVKKVSPFSEEQTQRIVLPVTGANGEIYGALTVSGKSAAWGDTEKRLILGFANQLGSTLEMQKMRQDLASAREKMSARIQEYNERGIATLQICSHCSRCCDNTATQCPIDGAQLRTPQILPYRILNRYRMIRLLGHGGTGTVFQAHDEKLNRFVAVKILRKEYPEDANQRKRWEREAHTIARLQHPGIVGLYDLGELEDGSGFLIMEFLEGVDMARIVKVQGAGTPSQVALVLEQVGDALKSAHEAGVIHRDLKPANLFMLASSSPFRIKVVDFGLAKSLTEDSALTRTGMLLGSPSYMSPEQIRGQRLDERSDLFSLAGVAYEFLTSKPAFCAEVVTEVLVRVLSNDPPPLATHIKDAPPELQRSFDWALHKEPNQRPDSVSQWLQHTLPILRSTPTSVSGWQPEQLIAETASPADPNVPTGRV